MIAYTLPTASSYSRHKRSSTVTAVLQPSGVIAALSLMFLRPALLGEQFALLGVLGLVVVITIQVATKRTEFEHLSCTQVCQIILINAFWLYTFFITSSSDFGRWDFVLKAWAIQIVVTAFALTCASSPTMQRAFLTAAFYFLVLLSLSSLATTILMITLSADFGVISTYDYGYRVEATLYMPFSVVYNWIYTPPHLLPRFSMWFREAGIAPIFLLWGAVYGYHYNHGKILIGLLLLGCVLTLSTVGIASGVFGSIILLGKHFRANRAAMTAIIVTASLFAILLIYVAPIVGMEAKALTARDSIVERQWALYSAMENIWLHPAGLGMYRDVGATLDVSLLSSIDSIGVVGFLVFLMFMCLPILDNGRTVYLCFGMPAVAIAMFSQPLIDAAGFTLLFLIPFWREHPPSCGRILACSR